MTKTIEDLSIKFLLTIEEASRYFGIGENKLRAMASYGKTPDWAVYNGKRMLIKREKFEKYLLDAETI